MEYVPSNKPSLLLQTGRLLLPWLAFSKQPSLDWNENPGVSGNDFWGFGNGKGIEKTHSLNSGTGREWKKNIPKIREWEENEN